MAHLLRVEHGLMLLDLQRHAEAVTEFDHALAFDADLDAAYFGRGIVIGRLGRIDTGIADLATFIARNPRSAPANTRHGVATSATATH